MIGGIVLLDPEDDFGEDGMVHVLWVVDYDSLTGELGVPGTSVGELGGGELGGLNEHGAGGGGDESKGDEGGFEVDLDCF